VYWNTALIEVVTKLNPSCITSKCRTVPTSVTVNIKSSAVMITVYLSVCLSCFITLCLGQFRYLELELSQVSELELYSLFLVWNDIPVSHRLYVLCLIHSKRLSRFLNLVLCCGPFEHALKYGPRAACCPQSQLVLECGSCSRISSSLITAAASFMVS
jgi:hypothetical protein